jgi:hypothetical protein
MIFAFFSTQLGNGEHDFALDRFMAQKGSYFLKT